MKLGLVTYNLAKSWDVPTIIKNCRETGFSGVELRTTHAHGVEPTLGEAERAAVKEQFRAGGIEIAGLGTTCEYHSPDPEEVRRNIEATKDWVLLARDLGCPGVKVRPNGLQVDKGIPREQTLRQIGEALAECGAFAADHGVEIRLEVHGRDTQDPRNLRAILDVAGPQVYACWNSNPGEVVNGSIKANFALLRDRIRLVHMRNLYEPDYPWRELLQLLKGTGYQGYTLIESGRETSDPFMVMSYCRALWEEMLR